MKRRQFAGVLLVAASIIITCYPHHWGAMIEAAETISQPAAVLFMLASMALTVFIGICGLLLCVKSSRRRWR